MKRGLIIIGFAFIVLTFQSCGFAYAVFMNMPTRERAGKWKDGKYKVKIQSRQDYVGPHYYRCKVKKKALGGLFYYKIASDMFSGLDYSKCKLDFPSRKDTIMVNVCTETVTKKMK